MRKTIKLVSVSVVFIILLIITSRFWAIPPICIDPELRIEIEDYCKKHNLSQDYCIIVDYSRYSGKDRLFIVDLGINEILYSGLCAHGIGKDFDCIVKPKFSNENGSNLSSLGHYKLGHTRKTTHYDLNAIELQGLDSTNSNAYSRGILIHDGMPNLSLIGVPCLPLSQGCFTVTSRTIKEIQEVMSCSNKPLLLYATDKSVFYQL